MTYIKVLQVFTNEGKYDLGGYLAEIEFCWGYKKGKYNVDRAIVFLRHLRLAIEGHNIQELADAFNLPSYIHEKYNYSILEHFVAFYSFVRNWDKLKTSEIETKKAFEGVIE